MQTYWAGGTSAYEFVKLTYIKFREQFEGNIETIKKMDEGLARQIEVMTYWIFDCDPRRCLANRPLYILGYNPAAAGENKDFTLPEHWDSLATWESDLPEAASYLVNRIRRVANAILNGIPDVVRCPFEDVPRSTLYFYRTHAAGQIAHYKRASNGTKADFDCWDYHQELIALIRPAVILCYGNGNENSTFSDVCSRLGGPLQGIHDGESWYNKRVTKFAEVRNDFGCGMPILLIGVPHLSRYDPDSNSLWKDNENRVLNHMTTLVKNHYLKYPRLLS